MLWFLRPSCSFSECRLWPSCPAPQPRGGRGTAGLPADEEVRALLQGTAGWPRGGSSELGDRRGRRDLEELVLWSKGMAGPLSPAAGGVEGSGWYRQGIRAKEGQGCRGDASEGVQEAAERLRGSGCKLGLF